jgi:hypothetical protein
VDAKILLLIALLAPVLMLAAGIFARRESAEPALQPEQKAAPNATASLF